MKLGIKIKTTLLEIEKTQMWLSRKTGIPYDKLNSCLCDKRSLSYDDFQLILWAINKSASDFIEPKAPSEKAAS